LPAVAGVTSMEKLAASSRMPSLADIVRLPEALVGRQSVGVGHGRSFRTRDVVVVAGR
jgi:hypothetical protein